MSQTRVESNKISRTARGQRGVFWELNNARREEKVDIAVCLAGQDPQFHKRVVVARGQGNVRPY